MHICTSSYLLIQLIMFNSTAIATTGVAMLLLAFFLNLFGILKQNSWTYLLLNFFGAALSCYASWLINFLPFVILEATWAGVAGVGAGRKLFLQNK
ncbi:MAG: hypothetical protein LH473_01180 [Chitinophagales bacterium]|nr:hypothetical protein [Chitinophagales bacterium]